MKIYQLTNITAYQMMGYVIKTEDGKNIVIDGGNYYQSAELERIVDIVGTDIDMWILTHAHNDHFGSVEELLEKRSDIKISKFLESTLSDDYVEKYVEKNDKAGLSKWNNFKKDYGLEAYSPKAGETFSVGNVKIEILDVSSPEIHDNVMNNQSMTVRISENGFSVIFLGDLGVEGGEKLLKNCADIHADAVQMAHHGQQGVEKAVYEKIAPKYALWPTPKWLWENTEYLGGIPGTGPFKTPEVAKWMEEIGTTNIFSFEKTAIFDTSDKSVSYV